MRTLTFTQITDSRFDNEPKELLQKRIDKIIHDINNLEGVKIAHDKMYKCEFDNNYQYRAHFYIQKNTRHTTWNDIYKTINNTHATKYTYININELA